MLRQESINTSNSWKEGELNCSREGSRCNWSSVRLWFMGWFRSPEKYWSNKPGSLFVSVCVHLYEYNKKKWFVFSCKVWWLFSNLLIKWEVSWPQASWPPWQRPDNGLKRGTGSMQLSPLCARKPSQGGRATLGEGRSCVFGPQGTLDGSNNHEATCSGGRRAFFSTFVKCWN